MRATANRDVWQLLNGYADPGRPFVTTNFAASGRIELSVTTFINGAAKAANAFRDVIDADAGALVQVDLGWTWQQAVWQCGALIAGSELVTQDAEIGIYASGQSPSADSGEWFGISIDGWGRPQGCEGEITAEVLGQPDGWMYPEFFGSQVELIAKVHAWGEQHGIAQGARIGIDTRATPETVFIPFLLPVVFSGSVVMSDKLDESVIAQEQISHVLAVHTSD
ncbi:MAG: hypothetical protein WAO33_07705 [Candidatus Nanopelagicales bacterium]|jgi:uncharacterized protein (TIGR03089 family)|nr:hypothetical protein [Actinomycetes bacterium]